MTRLARRGVLRAASLLSLVACATWWFDRVEVVGSSMAPTFAPGDRLLVVRRWRALREGDVVALPDPTYPTRTLVKRVARIDDDRAVVVGDNEGASTDSRSFGPVPVQSVRHLVVRRYARGRDVGSPGAEGDQ